MPPFDRPRPRARILQFGGGNFLRGFFDWKIDVMNQAAGTDWGIVILRSVGSAQGSALNAQGGLYTVLTRGIGPNGPMSEPRVVGSVLEEIGCQTDWPRILDLACDPAIEVVTSNTTEAGIVLDPAARLDDAPPASFPAKLAVLMAHRWRAGLPGWQVIPCELTDKAGDLLRGHVLAHARAWDLPEAFVDWVETTCSFHNTLVDRIVPGRPKADLAAIEADLGYADPCLIAAEPFHFLAIECRPGQPRLRLPLADWDPGTIVVPDVAPWKLRKVALLNGAHTALCPLALIAGVPTVGAALSDPAGRAFLARLIETEIKPFLDLPRADIDAFADEVMNRFANPFIAHAWHDISLNAISKIAQRNLDRMAAYQARHHHPAPLMALSLAAWAVFYTGRFPGALALPPRDAPEHLARVAALKDLEGEALVSAWLSQSAFWGTSLDEPGLRAMVLRDYLRLTAGPFHLADWPELVAANPA